MAVWNRSGARSRSSGLSALQAAAARRSRSSSGRSRGRSSGGGGSSGGKSPVVVTAHPHTTPEISEAAKQSSGNYTIKGNGAPTNSGNEITKAAGTPNNPIKSNAPENYPFIVNSQTRTVVDGMINPNVPKPSGMKIYQQTLQAISKLPLVGSTAKTIETVTINPKTGEFAPVAPFVHDVTAQRLNEWNEFDGSGKERDAAGRDAALNVGLAIATFGTGALVGAGVKGVSSGLGKAAETKVGQIVIPKLTTPLIKGEGKIAQQIGKHSTPLNIGLNSAAGHSIASTSVGVGKKFAESPGAGTIAKQGAGTIAKQGAGTIPLTESVRAIANTIPKPVTKIAKQGAQTAGGLLGFGTLGNIGADNPITEKTTEFSGSLRQISNDLIHSGDPGKVVAGVVSAPVLGIVSGGAGLAGGIPAAGKGILDIATGKNTKTITAAAADTVTGFIDYVGQGAQQNPLFLAGKIAGFSKGYKRVAKTPGNIIKTVETKIGLIDTRIVNTGDTKIVPAQNPLLSSAISGGAVNAEGMLRLDTATRATISQKGINLYDNKGSLIKIKNKSGEVIAALGKSHPLSKEGGLDLQRSAGDYPYHTKGQIDKIPFVYGTSSMNEAGTVLGLLDKTGVATVNKIASSVVYATVPLSITTHRGNVVKYKMSDKVITGKDGKTQSVNQYIPNQMTETYKMRNTGEINKNTETFKEAYQENQGLYPITAPKKFNTEWNIQNELEFAWTTKDGADPIFKTAKFGGFTTEGNTILKLGSNDSLIKTLNENRKANKDRVKNPAVRSKSNTEVLDLRNTQADVVRFFARDVAFRLAETVGKPEIKSDITKHGAEHVEDVAGLAKILKDLQGEKFSKISDKEIYYAGILHDAAKNTAAENVPGGHGEMVGSVLPAVKTILKIIIASEAFKTLMAVLLDWLCAQIAKTGEWLMKKTQERKKKYIDDEDLFE